MQQHQAEVVQTQRQKRPPFRLWLLIGMSVLLGIVVVLLSLFIAATQGIERGASIFTIITAVVALVAPITGWVVHLFKKHRISSPSPAYTPSSSQPTRAHMAHEQTPHNGTVSTGGTPSDQLSASPLNQSPSVSHTTLLPLQREGAGTPSPHTDPQVCEYFHVPYKRNQFFTGREDPLQHLHEELIQGRHSGFPCAICGLGGMGKTQLVLEYAYRFRESYQAVFWVRADARETLLLDMISVAQALHVSQKDEQDQALIIEATHQWFATHAGWLLIFDNVEDLELLNQFIPAVHHGSIVLTTRTQTTTPLAQAMELEKMSEEEATVFLLQRAGLLRRDAPLETASPEDLAHAYTIARLLDGLPLALDQAGGYILETGCGSDIYLTLYQQRQADLLQRRGRFPSDHPASVSTTFSLAFEQAARVNPAAAALLQFCAFLQPDAIAEEIVLDGAIYLEPPLQTFATDLLAFNEAIETLRQYSLLRRNAATKIFTMHRLVQAVIRGTMNRDLTRRWVEQIVKAIHTVMPYADPYPWSLTMRHMPHVLLCAEHIKHINLSSLEAAHILRRAGRYLRDRLEFEEAEVLLQQAWAMCEYLLGSSHFETLRCLTSIAILHQARGEYARATTLLEQIVKVGEEHMHPSHPHYPFFIQCLTHVAELYCDQGWYQRAEPLLQRTLRLCEEELRLHQNVIPEESIRRMLVCSLRWLGAIRREQGNAGEAKSLLLQGFILCQQSVVQYQEKMKADLLFELAKLDERQGNIEEAEQHFLESLTIYEQIHEASGISMSAYALGKYYVRQERYEKVEPLLQRALTLREHQFGRVHPETGEVLQEYLALLRKIGREDEVLRVEAHFR